MLRKLWLPAMAVLIGWLPMASQGAIVTLGATLTGAQEVPATGSTAIGAGAMTLNSDTGEFVWNITFTGLSNSATAAHFHGPAAIGLTANPKLNLDTDPGSIISTLGFTSGGFAGQKTLLADQVTDILNDLWYINIHTSTFPGGETRGQVLAAQAGGFAPVPIPAAVWLFVPALGLLSFIRRRPRAT